MSRRAAEVLPPPGASPDASADDRLQYGLDVSGAGIIDHDLVADTIYCSPRVFAIYGWHESLTVTVQTFVAHAHPDERERMHASIVAAHDPSAGPYYQLDYRIVRTDGEVRWVSVRAKTFFEGEGRSRRAVRVIGAITDVTEARAAAELLREREASLRRSERLAGIGYFTVDEKGETVTSSEGNNRIWGFPIDAVPSNADFRTRVSPEGLARFRAAWAEIGAGHDHVEFEFTIHRPDGTDVIVRSLMEAGRDPLTDGFRVFGTNIDVTAQKRAEAARVVSEDRLGQAVRLGRLGIFDYDRVTGAVYWSAEQRAIWGIGPDDDPGRAVAEGIHPEDRDRVDASLAAVAEPAGDGLLDFEHRIVRPDGELRWIHVRAQTYFERDGPTSRRLRTVGATADITERKRAERDLMIKQDAIASAVTGILICDLDTRIVYVNDAWLKIYRYDSAADVLGTTPLDHLVDPEQHAAVRRSMAATGHFVGMMTGRRRDGSTFVGDLVVSKITDASGAPVAFLGSILDATDRLTAQTALASSEAVLRSVFDASLDAIMVGQQQRLVLVNPATAAMFGYDSTQEMRGLSFSSMVAPSELERVVQINEARETGGSAPAFYETRLRRKDGSEFDAEISASSYTIDGTTYPVAVARDITARKAAERAMRESAERLAAVFNSTSDGQLVYRVDDDGRLFIVAANRAYREIRHSFFPDAPPQVEGQYREEMLARQGLSPEAIEGEMPALREVIASHRPVQHEFEVPLPTGELSVVEARIEPVLDDRGRCTHLLWSGRDIRARRQAETAVRQMNATLEHRVAERTTQLEAANRELEAFAYSVSHDLRAPARAVDGYAGILIEDYGPTLDEEGLRLCGVIRSEAQRMGRLIDDLLMLSRLGRAVMQHEPVDMTSLVREVFDELTRDVDRTRLTLSLDVLPRAVGDRSLLRRLWVNLLSNALKFSAQVPRAIIEVRGEQQADEAVFTVRDNGAGFDMAYQQKLFGVFQRLHSDHEFSGTGVGLAIVQRVVQRHGGRVWADGAVGRGAAFSFTVPVEARP